MICLNDQLRSDILDRLHAFWANIFTNKLPKNRNEIILCTNASSDTLFYKQPFDDKKMHNPNFNNGDVMTLFRNISKNINYVKF